MSSGHSLDGSHRSVPLAVAGTAALVSVGGLWLALSQHWLGADVGRGAEFCEAARDRLVRQPANTASNAGFVVAGLLVAWHVSRSARSGTLSRSRATTYAVVVVLLGPGSAAMHASQSTLGGHLDTTSMYLFASFVVGHALARWRGWGDLRFGLVMAGLVVACELVAQWPHPVPVVMFAGNLAFATLLLLALVMEVLLSRSRRDTAPRWGAAVLLVMLAAFGIWNVAKDGSSFCAPDSVLQGHAVWHLLGAVAAYSLYRYWASGAPQTVERSRPSQ